MPSLAGIIARFTDNTILYWERKGDDGFGKPTYAQPVSVKVRWEDKQQEIILPDGRKVKSTAYILLSSAMTVGGIVWQGTMDQWIAASISPGVPSQEQGGREIIKVNTTPGFRQLTGFVAEVYV